MLYMIVEDFRGDPEAVYRRFRDQGRLAPDGLRYVNSWVTADLQRCYQIMECADPALLQEWISRWNDLVKFEVIPVITSPEATEIIGHRLEREGVTVLTAELEAEVGPPSKADVTAARKAWPKR